MILLKNLETALKNGLYLDYFFKNICISSVKFFFSKNLFYFLEKYFTEQFFYSIKNFLNIVFNLIQILKNLQFYQLVKITLLIGLQLFLIYSL